MRALSLVLIAFFTTVAQAQTTRDDRVTWPGQQYNGCGAQDGFKVPNNLGSCKLEKACNAHDLCYGRCLKGGPSYDLPHCEYLRCRQDGDLYGKPQCQGERYAALERAASLRRATCDGNFFENIRVQNQNLLQCTAIAGIYYSVVKILGNANFAGLIVRDSEKFSDKLIRGLNPAQLRVIEEQGFSLNLPIESALQPAQTDLNANGGLGKQAPFTIDVNQRDIDQMRSRIKSSPAAQ